MKIIRLYLALLSLFTLASCSTPGTTMGGSGLGSLMDAVLDIPMTILSIPADILGDPSTMGAIAQAANSYSDSSYSSSYDSGSNYSSSSSSGGSSYNSSPSYTNSSTAETRYTGVNKRLIGSTGSDDSSDSSDSAQDGVKAFEQSQMAKVEAYKRWVNGGGGSSTSAGGTLVSTANDATRHSKMVPAASAGEWAYVGEFEGVRVWWKYRRELKDQYESALKMENLNSYKAMIFYKPWFIAADGTEHTESGYVFSIRAGQVLTGNSAGLFYYVKDAQKRSADGPQSGGVMDMLITPES